MKHRIIQLICLLIVCPFYLKAEVTLPHFFSDNMVLQRNVEVPVWGKADRRENITLTFQGQEYTTQADKEGKWKIKLPATPAGGPHRLTITGENIIRLENILFGDVYLASGQSNMVWEMYNLPEGLETAGSADEHPEIRLFLVENKRAFSPQEDVPAGAWQIADSSSVLDFSAIAYYFGRYLQQELDVPIGLIGSYWGGTAVEAWMSSEVLDSIPKYKSMLNAMERYTQSADELEQMYSTNLERWVEQSEKEDRGFSEGWYRERFDDQNWESMQLPAPWKFAGLADHDGAVWFRKTFFVPKAMSNKDLYIHLPRVNEHDIVWVNGQEVGRGKGNLHRVYQIPRSLLNARENVITVRVFETGYQGGIWGHEEDFHITDRRHKIALRGDWKYRKGVSWDELPVRPNTVFSGSTPMMLYNGMIAPLIPFALKGIIWYQGERNASRAYEYRTLFPMMIKDWRKRWQQEELPFLYVQLANYKQPAKKPEPSEWAELREAQQMALSLPNTGMATAIDLGEAENIHPANKKDVGRRLALAARAVIYDEDIVHQGPVFDSMHIVGNQIAITFKTHGSPLKVDDQYGYVRGFTIAREDREFVRAKAYILNDSTVMVYHDTMINPAAARYGWADNPEDINLYNEAGLPALPFRTDDWPGKTYESASYSLK
ncbi:sialate O-acetylesterase [Catalinimonas alkaloidigena]|uniref:sialate O-acetylesterase n=1 Tax=Catalinimonas alkaloidigena TaxID=1075417 RepID=UPI002406099D|nr:sialate O-acetylesterase [Catalinimonas alkaloidigena]MDF9798406.1 sialate O-acetylesterase [Catalinimonas alkaloidigena]